MLNTTLCYIEKEGSYLMLHRVKKKNDINRDKWIGIGGKFEEGESPEDCVRREVREETGLELKDPRYAGIVTFQSDGMEGTEFMHLFHAKKFTGEIRDCDEGVLEWISKEKFATLPHWDGDRIFLTLLDREAPFFSLKLTYRKDVLVEALLNEKRVHVEDFSYESLAPFPPMRHSDRQMTTEDAQSVLKSAEYGILSTTNSVGYPYGIPLNFAFDGKNIWFHGAQNAGEKFFAFERDSKACFTVVQNARTKSEEFTSAFESCIVFGKVHLAKDPRTGLQRLVEKYSREHLAEGEAYIERALAHTAVFQMEIENICGKRHL